MLWIVNYPDGRIRRVTNDLNSYRAIGLTQDGKKLTTVQAQGLVNLWVVPEGDADEGDQTAHRKRQHFYSSTGNNVVVDAGWTESCMFRMKVESLIFGLPIPMAVNRKQLTANSAANVSPSGVC